MAPDTSTDQDYCKTSYDSIATLYSSLDDNYKIFVFKVLIMMCFYQPQWHLKLEKRISFLLFQMLTLKLLFNLIRLGGRGLLFIHLTSLNLAVSLSLRFHRPIGQHAYIYIYIVFFF